MLDDGPAVRRAAIRRRQVAAAVAWLALLSSAPTVASVSATPVDAGQGTIRAALAAGRFVDAEALAAADYGALETTQPSDPASADLTNLYVETLVRNGRGADPRTRALAEGVLRHTTWPPAARATALRNLTDVLIASGDYKAALDTAQRARDLRAQAAVDALDLAEDLDRVARALVLLDRYGEVAVVIDRAIAIKEAARPRDVAALARTLALRATLHQGVREYARARAVLAEVVKMREAPAAEHPDLADALRQMAVVCWIDGDLKQSQHFAARALAIAERLLRPDHPDLSAYLKSLALPTQDLGDPSRALVLRERALGIAERALGPDHPVVADQLNDLAISLDRQAEVPRARGRSSSEP